MEQKSIYTIYIYSVINNINQYYENRKSISRCDDSFI
jgi:hypothetical protein